MRITEVARGVGATPDEIRYLEKKGYIRSGWVTLKERHVRDYSEDEVRKIQIIIKHRRQGFELDIAYKRTLEELEQPPLL